jgi:hypothetical protein
MSSRSTAPESPRDGGVDEREAREMALFLVRVFGDEAAEVVAERSEKSEQRQDWQRVGGEVEKLLDEPGSRTDPRPLRLFT